MSGVTNTPTFFDGPLALRIDVIGSFYLGPNVNWQSVCVLGFGSNPAEIQSSGAYISNQIEISGSSLTMLDDLHCYSMSIEGGNLITSDFNLHCTHAFTIGVSSVDTLYLGTSTIRSELQMDFLNQALIFGDSATFISPNFNVNYGIYGLHFGTVIAPYISSEGCFFKVIQSPSIAGLGNTIGLMTSDTIMVDYSISTLAPNHFNKVIAGHVFGIHSSTIVDTLVLTAPGAELGITDTLTVEDIIMNNTPVNRGMVHYAGWINKTSGTLCLDFIDIDSVEAIGGAQFFAGYNSTMLGSSPGWQFTGCLSAGGVWPGDANYDLTVNNLDILAIGLANGETGPARAGASLSWTAQPVADWTNSFASGVNMKHADCDGNGIVDGSDTAAVALNYGLHHPAVRLIQPVNNPNSNSSLTIDISPDTVGPA